MNGVEKTIAISVGDVLGDNGLSVTQHDMSISGANANLGNLHDSFMDKMENFDESSMYINIDTRNSSAGGNSLSDHLLAGYQAARSEHDEALSKVAKIFDKDKIEFTDIMDARQILESQKYKGALAVKAVEKSMETFNSLLRMQ